MNEWRNIFFEVKFTNNNSGLLWIRYKCTLLAKHFARNLFCADGMIKEIWAMDQTLSRHYSSIPSWMLAPKHLQEQSVHLSNTLQHEKGRGREREGDGSKRLMNKCTKERIRLKFFRIPGWTASRKAGLVALCTECHFNRTRTKRTQTVVVCTTVCGNDVFCTCIPFYPVGQLLSLRVSKTDILYERFMRLRCKRHSTASQGKQNLHLRAKSPVCRYARARLEILPVKTVKRGEARQSVLDSWTLFLRKSNWMS